MFAKQWIRFDGKIYYFWVISYSLNNRNGFELITFHWFSLHYVQFTKFKTLIQNACKWNNMTNIRTFTIIAINCGIAQFSKIIHKIYTWKIETEHYYQRQPSRVLDVTSLLTIQMHCHSTRSTYHFINKCTSWLKPYVFPCVRPVYGVQCTYIHLLIPQEIYLSFLRKLLS